MRACGLPYYISGVIQKREELISRTPGKFAQEDIRVLKRRAIEAIDLRARLVSGRDLETGRPFTDPFDRLVLAMGAQPIRPRIEGTDLGGVFYLRSIFDADAILEQIGSKAVTNVRRRGRGLYRARNGGVSFHLGKRVTIVNSPPDSNLF